MKSSYHGTMTLQLSGLVNIYVLIIVQPSMVLIFTVTLSDVYHAIVKTHMLFKFSLVLDNRSFEKITFSLTILEGSLYCSL